MSLRYGMIAILIFTFFSELAARPGDWPQWRGPNRDGISSETGLLKNWPEAGPKVLWRGPSGDGYSGVVVADGRLFTSFGSGSDEVAVCLDAVSGQERWRTRIDSKYTNEFGHGTRSTPTVNNNIVYFLSAKSQLHALDAKTGKKVWSHDLVEEYGAQIPTWGVSASPLIQGDLLVLDVGGKDGYGIVAFNKKTGEVTWKSPTDAPGYSAPIAVSVAGRQQIICFTGKALVSVSPKDGRQFWSYEWITSYDVNAATPIFVGPDKVFISSGYGKGAALLKMIPNDAGVKVEKVWESKEMRNHFASSVLIGNHLYGFDEGTLKCMNIDTRETTWAKRGYQKGSFTIADGHIIVLSERGVLALVAATPEAFVEKAHASMLKGRCWTVPTLANGRLYIRNQTELLCLDLKDKNES